MALPSLEAVPMSSISGNKDFFFSSFPEGVTKIRVLSQVVPFFRYWSTQQKAPKNLTVEEGQSAIINSTPPDNQKYNESDIQKLKSWGRKESQLPKVGEPKPIVYLWGFIGFNYNTGKLHCFQLSQRTLLQALRDIDEDFEETVGDIQSYDLKITKNNTTYTALGVPKQTPFDFNLVPEDQEYEKMDIHKLIFGESATPATSTPITQESSTAAATTAKTASKKKDPIEHLKKELSELEGLDGFAKGEKLAALTARIDNAVNMGKITTEQYNEAVQLIMQSGSQAGSAPSEESTERDDDIPW